MLNKGIQSDNASDAPVYSFSDEVTKGKIKRHLSDVTDIITEKDIKNAKIPGAEEKNNPAKTGEKTIPRATTKKKTRKSKNTVVDDTPGNPETPWDILAE